MSIDNPYSSSVFGWKIDPDGRQNRASGPVTTRMMTEEEKQKYGIAGNAEGEDMRKGVNFDELNEETKALVLKADKVTISEPTPTAVKLTKAEVLELKAEGKSLDEIAEYFAPVWGGRLQLLKAKISLYMSDKKSGGRKKKVTDLSDQKISAINSHEGHPKPETMPELPGAANFIDEICPKCGSQMFMGKSGKKYCSYVNCTYGFDIDKSEQPETEEYPDIKDAAAEAGKEFNQVAKDSMDRIKLANAVDEMLEMVPDKPDNVNHPSHYNSGKFEVIEIIESIVNSMNLTPFEGFCIGCAVKYIARWKNKGGIEDLEKASWYLNRIIDVKKTA